jgi:hypothetical protein
MQDFVGRNLKERDILENLRKYLRMWEDVDLVLLVHDREIMGSFRHGYEHLGSTKSREFHEYTKNLSRTRLNKVSYLGREGYIVLGFIQCSSETVRTFGGTYRLHLQAVSAGFLYSIHSTLQMDVICSFETSSSLQPTLN